MAIPPNNPSLNVPGAPISLKAISGKLTDLERRIDGIRPFPISEAWSNRINTLTNVSVGTAVTIGVIWAVRYYYFHR